MPLDALPTPPITAPQASEATPDRRSSPGESCAAAIAEARRSLAAHLAAPADAHAWTDCRNALRRAATMVAHLERAKAERVLREAAVDLAREVIAARVHERLSLEAAPSLPDVIGWPTLVARMMLSPGWQDRTAISFENVPDWLWAAFSEWAFQPPSQSAEDSVWQAYGAAAARRLNELARWIARNRGSRAVREAAEAYLRGGAGLPRTWRGAGWREFAEARGRVLTQFVALRGESFQPPISPRAGRRLRVGFLQESFGPSAETFRSLACCEALDTQQFEVMLFALSRTDSREERYGDQIATFKVLPAALDEQVSQLRAEQLDVLVFAGSPGVQFDGVTKLALHRLAALQVVNDGTGRTSGLPEIDLHVTGGEPPLAAAEFTERLGLVQGAPFAYKFLDLDADAETASRRDLGLPHDVPLLATTVQSSNVAPETLSAWGDILQHSSTARLVVVHIPGAGPDETPALCAKIDEILAARGIADDRVIVMPVTPGQINDTKRVLRVVDAYLDPLRPDEPMWGALALALRVPVIAWGNADEGAGSPASIMLRSVGATELVASTDRDYVRLAAEFLSDAARLAAVRKQIGEGVAAGPAFLDTLAASDAFGALLETAFDELSALSSREFRAATEPIACFSTENLEETLDAGFAALDQGDAESASFEAALALRAAPANSRARFLRGRVLLAQDNPARATDYLLAAVERDYATDPRAWLVLAQALRADCRMPQAIEALQTCLRLDGANIDALLVTLELAEQTGGQDLADEVKRCLQEIAPGDPRVQALL